MNPRKDILRNRIFSILWVAGVCALSGWLVMSASGGAMINADLLALLPKAERDPMVNDAASRVNRRFERRLAMLVGAPTFETAKNAARRVYENLTASGQFRHLRLKQGGDLIEQMISFYAPLRFQLLGDVERSHLLAGDVAAFERTILKRYYSPQSTLSSGIIENDPLLLLPSFLEQGAARTIGRSALKDGYLTATSDGKIYIVLLGDLSDSPFSISLQRKLMPVLDKFQSDLPDKFPGATFQMAGVLPHAAAGTDSAFDETTTVGLGSFLGIILLLFVIFRSPRPLVLSIVSIGLGCLGGFAACIAIFGEIHLLTLVFGASLVGISVDYSLHYFCERYRFKADWSPISALRHIMPGITLGLITSVIGFAGLFFAPFPGMQGMAVFSSVGLGIAFGCVVFCYPNFSQSLARPVLEQPLHWMRVYGAFWARDRNWRTWSAIIVFTLLAILGCLRLDARDDIRLLQTPDPGVVAEERKVQALMGQNLASQYFLVEGRDETEFLEGLEDLSEKLLALQHQGRLAGHITISNFIASPRRQKENQALLTPLIVGDQTTLRRIARQIGLPARTRDAYAAAFREATRAPPLGLKQWLSDPVSRPYRDLWLGRTARGVIGITGLRGVSDLEALREIANAQPRVSFIDPAGEISDLFGQYRRQTTWLTLLSYGVVLLILLMRYGIRGGLLVMAVPVIAATTSLSVIGLLGEPINLFNIMALLLVLGIGVDYALFYRETGMEHPSTLLAIALSSITTVLAFGLLALSKTNAIHSFGLTILVGILTAFVFSPMAGWKLGGTPVERGEHRP
jgi:predicted exporter